MNDLNLFREEVQKHFGRPIVNRRDCEELSVLIFEQTGQLISYNTLRRFFDLAGKTKTTISQTSLNILANYCGYEHYFQFDLGIAKTNFSSEQFHEVKLNCMVNQKIDFDAIYRLVDEFKGLDQTYSFLHELVIQAFQMKDVEFIKRIFDLTPIFENTHYLYSHVFFLVQSLGVQLRKEPDMKEEIWSFWAQHPAARRLYFELFVDMDELMSSHYLALDKYLAHSEMEHEKLFVHALLFFRAYNLGLKNEQEKHFSHLKNANLHTLHPILLGRIACYLHLHRPENLKSETLMSLLDWPEKTKWNTAEIDKIPFYQTWLCEGLLLLQAPQIILKVIKQIDKNFKLSRRYVNNGLIERINTYKGIALAKTGKKAEAKMIFDHLNVDYYNTYSRSYDGLYYLSLKYLLTPNEVNKTELFQRAETMGYVRVIENILATNRF
jgi:hypothetical protein